MKPLENLPKGGIALYLAMGRIDIVQRYKGHFQGRQAGPFRISASLRKNGYGEDKFGNNIVLPLSLSYLRR